MTSRASFFAVVATATLGATVIGAAPARGPTAGPAPEVRTSSPVTTLAAGGSTVAYALGCGELRVWSLEAMRVTPITAEVVDCGVGARYAHVAVARNAIIWSALEEHNHIYAGIHVSRGSRPGKASTLYDSVDEDIGALDADGGVVAFSTQGGGYYGGARAALWVGGTSRVLAIRKVIGWMDHVAVEGDLVAVGYRNGRVEVFRTNGTLVRVFPKRTAIGGVVIDRGRLVALDARLVQIRSVGTGAALLSRPVRPAGVATALLDARNGLVAYRSGGELRLLRLRDGRDVRIPAPNAVPSSLHARFAAWGLVVAYPGVVKLVVWSSLERILADVGASAHAPVS